MKWFWQIIEWILEHLEREYTDKSHPEDALDGDHIKL